VFETPQGAQLITGRTLAWTEGQQFQIEVEQSRVDFEVVREPQRHPTYVHVITGESTRLYQCRPEYFVAVYRRLSESIDINCH